MIRTMLMTMDFAPRWGGVASYWTELCKFIDNDQLVVLAQEADNSLDFDINQNYLIYRRCLLSKKEWLWPKWLPFLFEAAKLVRREKIKKIIVAQVLPGGTIALILKKIYNVPYVLSFHGLDVALAQSCKRKQRLARLIIKNAEAIIVNSQYTKTLVEKYHQIQPGQKLAVIYPCPHIVCSNQPDPRLKHYQEFHKKNSRVILTVARLITRKGHDMVIKALPQIIKKIPEAKYVIVGKGPEQANLEQLIKQERLDKQVKIMTDIADDELTLFYSLADVFVMPARQLPDGDVEGFGIVYLEANSFGLPVVAGASGGVSEAVEHGVSGLLVDPGNVNELAQAIISLFENPQKARQLGEQGRRRVQEKFSWAVQAANVMKILN